MQDLRMLFRCMCLMQGMFPRLIQKRKSIDAIFIWGRAADEWDITPFETGVLALAADIWHITHVKVVIPGYIGSEHGQGIHGYPGCNVWCNALLSHGLPINHIIPATGGGHNTKTEMENCLNLAVEHKWQTVVGITQPHHALRAMLGTVKSLQGCNFQDLSLKVVPAYPHRFDWQKPTHGSQGQGPLPRIEWIDQEFDRISRYQAQGDLCSFDELYSYLVSIHRNC